MKNTRSIIFWLAAVGATVSIVLLLIIYFENWDVIMSRKQRFLLNWKESLMLFVCFVIAQLSKPIKD